MKLFFGAILLMSVFNACKSDNNSNSGNENTDMALYTQAMAYNDYNTAIYAVQSMLLKDSTKDYYNDTLAHLYLKSENYPSALLASEKVLQKKPDDVKMLEIAVKSAEGVRSLEKMMVYGKKLMDITKDLKYNFHMARLYITMQDLDSVNYYLNSIMASPNNMKDSVEITLESGFAQKVPVKLAVLNVQAYLKLNENKINEAAKLFIEALKIDQEFEPARQGLMAIQNAGKR